jgi:hypothetical protein
MIVHDKDLVISGNAVLTFWFHFKRFNPHSIYI